MDTKDRQIIKELQLNGRLTNHELASKVNLSPSPCLRRIRNLEEQGVIAGYTAIIDQKAYGLPITAFVRIKLAKHGTADIRAFEKAIENIAEIQDCYLMTGDCDYLIKVIVSDLESYEKFVRSKLQNTPGIASMDTSFAYSKVKQNLTFPS